MTFSLQTLFRSTVSGLDWTTALIFPQYCPSCQVNMASSAGWICDSCWENHPPVRKSKFKSHPVLNGKVTIPFAYTASFRQLIHMMKFHGRTDIAVKLGSQSTLRFLDFNKSILIDAVVPVPLHPTRVRSRGYDQNLVIAQAVAETLDIECRDDIIFRSRNNPAQARLSDEERIKNLEGAFSAATSTNLDSPRSVLLVDDVVHTGTTVASCMAALNSADVKYIHILACCG